MIPETGSGDGAPGGVPSSLVSRPADVSGNQQEGQRARRSWGCVVCSGTLHSPSMAGECKDSAVMRRAERRSVSFQACKPRSCGTVVVACYILHRNAFLIRTTSRLDEPGIGHYDILVFRETGSM
jgi:hypothetical protein